MPIRVIAGTAKGRKLKLVPGESTRPVMDRVKEAVFNILGQGVVDAVFLDLYAGTGSVGIEALSRGAAQVVFVENDRLALATIHENLTTTRLADRAEVIRGDALAYLQRESDPHFDYVYVAPPQYKGMWKTALLMLDEYASRLNPDAVVMVQIDPVEREEVTLDNLNLYDERNYGNTTMLFYERVAVTETDEPE